MLRRWRLLVGSKLEGGRRRQQLPPQLTPIRFGRRTAASSGNVVADDAPKVCPLDALLGGRVGSGAAGDVTHAAARRPFDAIPTPRGLPLLGTILDVIRSGGAARIHEHCDNRHRELGSVYRERLGPNDAVFVSTARLIQKVYAHEGRYPRHLVPDAWTVFNEKHAIKRGLFFMDGPEWLERRKMLNQLFLRLKSVTDHVPIFNEVIGDLIDQWTATSAAHPEQRLEHLERELYNWSIESVGTMIFGRRLGCVSGRPKDSESIHEFVHCVQQIFEESANLVMVSPKLACALRLPVWNRFEQAAWNALQLARRYVDENMPELKNRNDSGCPQASSATLLDKILESNITIDEVTRIIVDLFLAAADTTSHATQWALYLLSRHPEAQQSMLSEIKHAAAGTSEISEDALSQMPYVKAVIKETLRLYPVAPFLTRILDQDVELNGYHVPAGNLILMSLYTTGRDGSNFKEPNAFRPERWLRDSQRREGSAASNGSTDSISGDMPSSKINSWACLPFGMGARSCIGRRVAEYQMQLLLARIVQRFELAPGQTDEIGIRMRLITTPEKPISLRLRPRVH